MEEIGELQVKLLWGNAMLPFWGSAGAVGYDLCTAESYVIPSPGKGTVETRLAVALPLGTYAISHHVQGWPFDISLTLEPEK